MDDVIGDPSKIGWQSAGRDFSVTPPETIELRLHIKEPELVAALIAHPEGRARSEFALTALRIGVLALNQAQGKLDSDALRSESERLISELNHHLVEHRLAVTQQLANSLKEYFDPESGRFSERVERLVRADGELEQVLQRQIGREDSELAKTLAGHFGETSPLMKLLSPAESKGLLQSLGLTLEGALKGQRDTILREFSLDSKESALSRLVSELTQRHGKLAEDLQGSIKNVVGEFSLDNEGSALSRLVRRVENAQKQISSEFSLDAESSALARMKRELLEVLEAHKRANAEFQQEVMTALAAMSARKEQAQRSTLHGTDFESAVHLYLRAECEKAGDVATHTGNTTGLIKNCKIGDVIIELGPDNMAAGAKIVIEAKDSGNYNLAKAREEIETARKNRDSGVGLFVFSTRTAPENLQSLMRYGNDIFVTWDAEDPASDVYLWAAISIAKALCTRKVVQREVQEADFESVERAIREIEKQAGGLDGITRMTETIKGNSEKILHRVRIMQASFTRQIDVLNEQIEDLKSAFDHDDSAD